MASFRSLTILESNNGDLFERIDLSGGIFYPATHNKFRVLRGLAAQELHLKPGATREPHSHPNAEQLDYCISGKARVGISGPESYGRLLALNEGDISFVPRGYRHWIQNIGTEALKFPVVLSHEQPETIELSETLIGAPKDTLSSMLGVPEDLLAKLSKKTVTIGGGSKL